MIHPFNYFFYSIFLQTRIDPIWSQGLKIDVLCKHIKVLETFNVRLKTNSNRVGKSDSEVIKSNNRQLYCLTVPTN